MCNPLVVATFFCHFFLPLFFALFLPSPTPGATTIRLPTKRLPTKKLPINLFVICKVPYSKLALLFGWKKCNLKTVYWRDGDLAVCNCKKVAIKKAPLFGWSFF